MASITSLLGRAREIQNARDRLRLSSTDEQQKIGLNSTQTVAPNANIAGREAVGAPVKNTVAGMLSDKRVLIGVAVAAALGLYLVLRK